MAVTTAHRRSAPMDIMIIIPMHARRMATTARTGSLMACSSVPVRGMAGIGAILAGTVAVFAEAGIMTVGAAAVGIATVFVVLDLPMKALDAADSTAAAMDSAADTASMTEEASTVEADFMAVVVSTEVEAVFMVEVAPTVVVTVGADPTEAEATADTVN